MDKYHHRERHVGEQDCERQSGLVTGIMLVAVGAAFMADRLGYWTARDIWQYWPVILIAIGLGKILDASAGRRRAGVWLLVIGGIFLMDTLEVFEIHDSWPLFIVAAGVMTVWRAIAPPAPRRPRGGPPPPVAVGDQAGTQS